MIDLFIFLSFQNDDIIEDSVEDSDKMPTASRESSRSRRSNTKTNSPPPQKAPPSKKVNGVKNNLTPQSTKDPKLLDILSDTECRLCERKNFKLGSETLGKGSF